MFCPHCSQQYETINNTVKSGVTMVNIIVDNHEQCGQHNIRYVYTLQFVGYDSHSGVCDRVSTRK